MNSQDKNPQSSDQAAPASDHSDVPSQLPAQTGQVSQERGPEPAPLIPNHAQSADGSQPKAGASSSLWWTDDEKAVLEPELSSSKSSVPSRPLTRIQRLSQGLKSVRRFAFRVLMGAVRPVLQKIAQIYYQKFFRF